MTHYETLGVPQDADDKTIKNAYRKLASKHHSDRGGDDEEMKKINIAYHVLSDPEKRKRYDETGYDHENDPIAQAGTTTLARMFAEYIMHGGNENPIDTIRAIVIKAKRTDETAILGKQVIIVSAEKKRKNIRRKKSEHFDLYQSTIDQVIGHAKTQIESLKTNVAIHDFVLALLNEYECDIQSQCRTSMSPAFSVVLDIRGP